MSDKIIARVTIKDNRYILIESRKENLDSLGKAFTFQDMSECFAGGRFRKEKVKNVNFMVTSEKVPTAAMLPIGFLSRLKSFLDYKEAKYKVEDLRVNHDWNYSDDEIEKSLGYIDLYDYQVESVKACLEHKSGIIKASTGAGKTEIFTSLCKLTNLKTLILFARVDLASQTLERMTNAGLDAGIVQGSNVDENHKIVMATVQSGHKLEKLEDYEMIITDECHRLSAPQYGELLSRSKARYRFGFSATPFVKDKYKAALTRMWTGDIIYEVDPKKLLAEKRIATPTIRMLTVREPSNIEETKWPACEKYGIIQNQFRNKLIVNLTRFLKGKILILVKSIEHGDFLHEMIPSSVWLSGANKSKERREAVKLFEKEEDFILIASTIFDEGIDIKTVEHLIIASGGSSYVKILQRIGRGVRVTATKTTVDVYDFFDATNRILEKHSKERIKQYISAGYDDIKYVDETLLKKLAAK